MVERARLIGINHVALEVGDVEQALDVYGQVFEFELRGRAGAMAFIDMGDQFLALGPRERGERDVDRHFGLVVDDKEAVRAAASEAGFEVLPSRRGGLELRDPWGNRIQIVAYSEVQFERTDGVKRALGIEDLQKTDAARAEITRRRLA
jgi:lactoylglutathione lyase